MMRHDVYHHLDPIRRILVYLDDEYEAPSKLPDRLEKHLTQAEWDVVRSGIADIVKEHGRACKDILE